jgi:hypothetical protein
MVALVSCVILQAGRSQVQFTYPVNLLIVQRYAFVNTEMNHQFQEIAEIVLAN